MVTRTKRWTKRPKQARGWVVSLSSSSHRHTPSRLLLLLLAARTTQPTTEQRTEREREGGKETWKRSCNKKKKLNKHRRHCLLSFHSSFVFVFFVCFFFHRFAHISWLPIDTYLWSPVTKAYLCCVSAPSPLSVSVCLCVCVCVCV